MQIRFIKALWGMTQGETLEDLKDHLRDLYRELTSGSIPGIRRAAELEVS